MKKNNSLYKVHIYASLAILIWATAFPVTKVIGTDISATSLALIRCPSDSVLLIVMGLVNRISFPKSAKTWALLFIAALSGFALYITFFSQGLKSITSATSSIIIALVPIMGAVGARIVYKERISIIGWISTFTAFGGVVVLMCWNGIVSINAGALWTLAAALCFFVYNMLNRELGKTLTSLEIVTFAMSMAAVCLMVFLSGTVRYVSAAPLISVLLAVYLGFFPSAISYFLWAKAFQHAEKATTVTSYMFATPVLATLLSVVMLHEVPDMGVYVGGGIILISLIVFNLKK